MSIASLSNTFTWPIRLVWPRTPPFHGGNAGSNPAWVTMSEQNKFLYQQADDLIEEIRGVLHRAVQEWFDDLVTTLRRLEDETCLNETNSSLGIRENNQKG